ncbi:hypothetical protein RF679_01290 [Undibacterium cyanobacteriorum]|uniref:Uncharacterized protein n=1 Tax=Undibacterium cyanobacteriorum TaxID=3073561 RepID=A0ABY9RIA5_9BURK|nr:hypothetical protein [Undibacterium sp. 20NA77.5]WMW80930.1 hypothetical protein RF679_01290 [Undibacterium sp. 20NA77.5]
MKSKLKSWFLLSFISVILLVSLTRFETSEPARKALQNYPQTTVLLLYSGSKYGDLSPTSYGKIRSDEFFIVIPHHLAWPYMLEIIWTPDDLRVERDDYGIIRFIALFALASLLSRAFRRRSSSQSDESKP